MTSPPGPPPASAPPADLPPAVPPALTPQTVTARVGAGPGTAPQPKIDDAARPNPWRVPAPPDPWQQFLLCLLFHLLFPLLPLGVEFFVTHRVATPSLYLMASTYAMGVCATSRSLLGFGFGVVVTLVYGALYGVLTGEAAGPHGPAEVRGALAPTLGIVVVLVVHALERYNRHVADRAPFFEFGRGKDA